VVPYCGEVPCKLHSNLFRDKEFFVFKRVLPVGNLWNYLV